MTVLTIADVASGVPGIPDPGIAVCTETHMSSYPVLTRQDATNFILTFAGDLDTGSIPDLSLFTFSPANEISAVAVTGETVTLTVETAVPANEALTVIYRKPDAALTDRPVPLQAVDGDEIDSFKAALWVPIEDYPTGTLLRWRAAWRPEGSYRGPDKDEMTLFRQGVEMTFGELIQRQFNRETSGESECVPAFHLHVSGIMNPVPILPPVSRAFEPASGTEPYGILGIRYTDREPTTLSGSKWTCRGQISVTLYRRPEEIIRKEGETTRQYQERRNEREQQVLKDLDGTATHIINQFINGNVMLPDIVHDLATGAPIPQGPGIGIYYSQGDMRTWGDALAVAEDNECPPVGDGSLVRWRGPYVADVDGNYIPLPPLGKTSKGRFPNGFRANLSSATAEDLGADGGTYRMRVVAPFTYDGPQR